MKKIIKSYRFPIILLLSMILGSLVGIFFPDSATYLKPFGDIFLNMMFTVVVPLVFFTIVSSISNMSSIKKLSKVLKVTFVVFVITCVISALVMLFVMLFINPVGNTYIDLVASEVESVSVIDQIVAAVTVTDFTNLLSRSHMLALIIFSVIFGISLCLVEKKEKKVGHIFEIISDALMKFVKIIMYYAPVGIFAYFAALISEFGPELIGSYAKSMILYYVLTVIYFLIFYTLYAYFAKGKAGIKNFYRNIFPSVITSLATQSSLATLPTNLNTADNMKIDSDVSKVALPIGATVHMEGSCMGSILKIVFLFSIFNYSFTGLDTYTIAILIAVLSGVVMSGIPGGGLIGEMLIVSLYGFPPEAFALIATIGWLIDPPATMLNVTGDVSSAMIIDKYVNAKEA